MSSLFIVWYAKEMAFQRLKKYGVEVILGERVVGLIRLLQQGKRYVPHAV